MQNGTNKGKKEKIQKSQLNKDAHITGFNWGQRKVEFPLIRQGEDIF